MSPVLGRNVPRPVVSIWLKPSIDSGTFLAPIIGGYVMLRNVPKAVDTASLSRAALYASRIQEAASVELPSLVVASTLAVLTIALGLLKLPSMGVTQDLHSRQANPSTKDQLKNYLQLALGVLGIFLYVGAEVAIGSFLISYFELPAIANLTARSASLYVSLYWGGSMIGCFVSSAILRRLSSGLVLGIAAAIATLLVITSMLSIGHVAMFTILAVGVINSVIFPSIFALGLADLAPLTGLGSSLMVAAMVGGAIIPMIHGSIADSSIGLHHAFILPLICFLYIAYFDSDSAPFEREKPCDHIHLADARSSNQTTLTPESQTTREMIYKRMLLSSSSPSESWGEASKDRFHDVHVVLNIKLVWDGEQEGVGLCDGHVLLELLDEHVWLGSVATVKDRSGCRVQVAQLIFLRAASSEVGSIKIVHQGEDTAAHGNAGRASMASLLPGCSEAPIWAACWTWNGSPDSSILRVELCRFIPSLAAQTAVAFEEAPHQIRSRNSSECGSRRSSPGGSANIGGGFGLAKPLPQRSSKNSSACRRPMAASSFPAAGS